MLKTIRRYLVIAWIAVAVPHTLTADDVKLTSIGPIAFGEHGVLFVSDPMAAKIYAVETGDLKKTADQAKFNVPNIKSKIASMLGAEADQIKIHDLAVNPTSGNSYLSVSRGKNSILLVVDAATNKISELELAGLKSTSTELPNPAESRKTRRGDQRMSTITDLAFIDGQVYVAGLSNEEFASNLRAIQYPFAKVSPGSSIEIYHGAHGKYETRSPVQTFAAYQIDGKTNLLAAYTCTPLVRIPVEALKEKSKVRGTTVAELGNWNRPLDIVVYKKDGEEFILIANSARGIMKINLKNIGEEQPITTKIKGTAGMKYETIKSLENVTQLASLNSAAAVVLMESDNGSALKSVDLP